MCKLYGNYHFLCKCLIGRTLLCSDVHSRPKPPPLHENYDPTNCLKLEKLDGEEVVLHGAEGGSCVLNLQLCGAPLHASIYVNEDATTAVLRNLFELLEYKVFGIDPQPEYVHDPLLDLDDPETKMKLEARRELFVEVVRGLGEQLDKEFPEEKDRKRWRPTYLQDCSLSGVVGVKALERWRKGCKCERQSQRKQRPTASSAEEFKDHDRYEDERRLNLDIVEGMLF